MAHCDHAQRLYAQSSSSQPDLGPFSSIEHIVAPFMPNNERRKCTMRRRHRPPGTQQDTLHIILTPKNFLCGLDNAGSNHYITEDNIPCTKHRQIQRWYARTALQVLARAGNVTGITNLGVPGPR
jgi:hypothetical protein